jgi:hypothetical protein
MSWGSFLINRTCKPFANVRSVGPTYCLVMAPAWGLRRSACSGAAKSAVRTAPFVYSPRLEPPNNCIQAEAASRLGLIQALGRMRSIASQLLIVLSGTTLALDPRAVELCDSLATVLGTGAMASHWCHDAYRCFWHDHSASCLWAYRTSWAMLTSAITLGSPLPRVAGSSAHSYFGRARLTTHSSRSRFAARLNSGVRRHGEFADDHSKKGTADGWAALHVRAEDAQEHWLDSFGDRERPKYGEGTFGSTSGTCTRTSTGPGTVAMQQMPCQRRVARRQSVSADLEPV